MFQLNTHIIPFACSLIPLTVGIYFARKYFNGPTVSEKLLKSSDLTGKIVIVTGASAGGIGFETSKVLHRLGATVVLAVRNQLAGDKAKELIEKENGNSDKLIVMLIDLADLASVKKFTELFMSKFNQLDILINNAGIMSIYGTTKQGVELLFGSNHLGHFLLTHLLLNLLKKSKDGRIINLTSVSANSNLEFIEKYANFELESLIGDCKTSHPNNFALYRRSKLANILFSKKLSRELALDSSNLVQCYSNHPGTVKSNMGKHMPLLFRLCTKIFLFPILALVLKSTYQGAQTTIHLALSNKKDLKSGNYYADCQEKVGSI
ncbi:predicted protein [Naegleria gruberi]|uniref:Predicted protein n=1 Tax=Naegleria gruberi TaxID=5762 RepID=D2W5V8_NAEGR|nr:uncharacterized protein NAEGRDRAFT_76802 [Naegleria gruberi]EFC35543.1 predicted protein [Naegleria gruberi]|eukprot:XP_002668287.1 predicted protein [Naegleria gruberi strain NEG-M]